MDEVKNQAYQLLSAEALGRALSLSKRTVFRLRSAGKLPEPIKVGASIRWRLSDIELFVRMGATDRKEFETFKDMVQGGEND